MSSKYRPWLERNSMLGGMCAFVMMNPSTADDELDDPTIRRCKGFAARFGLGRLIVANLFTARATNPADLCGIDDPVGPDADDALDRIGKIFQPGDRIICAWGACHGKWPEWFRTTRRDRIAAVRSHLGFADLHALGLTAAGDPRHPLYLKSEAPLISWP